jgi:hypothetical protein
MYICRDGRWVFRSGQPLLGYSMNIITRVPFW